MSLEISQLTLTNFGIVPIPDGHVSPMDTSTFSCRSRLCFSSQVETTVDRHHRHLILAKARRHRRSLPNSTVVPGQVAPLRVYWPRS